MIVTRFSPSPTGLLHLGNIRTAIISFLYSRKNKGIYYVRIEDTDITRSTLLNIQNIYKILDKFKINYFLKKKQQSKHLILYKKIIFFLKKKKFIFSCKCFYYRLFILKKIFFKKKYIQTYDNKCLFIKNQKNIINRIIINQKGYIQWLDLVSKKLLLKNKIFFNFILNRSNKIPIYNFCMVIDDISIKTSHILRGNDHVSNTPKQIYLFNYLCCLTPKFGHFPLLLTKEGKKISKRYQKFDLQIALQKGFLTISILFYILHLNNLIINYIPFPSYLILENINFIKLYNMSIRLDIKKLLWINNYYIKHIYLYRIIDIQQKKQNIKNKFNLYQIMNNFLCRQGFFNPKNLYSYIFYLQHTSCYIYYLINLNKKINIDIIKIIFNSLNNVTAKQIVKNFFCFNSLFICSKKFFLTKKEIGLLLRLLLLNKQKNIRLSNLIQVLGKKQILYRIKTFLNYV